MCKMNLPFIYSFITTSTFFHNQSQMGLFSKKSSKNDILDNIDVKGLPHFSINHKTTIKIEIAKDKNIRNEYDVLKKLNKVMKSHNADKILNERQTRRYPRHHFKRMIKQSKGFQMSDARREAYYSKHTEIPIGDDITLLRNKHMKNIMESVKYYDSWLNASEERKNMLQSYCEID
uniref:Uncharacterized protein n=1 Tax=Theileria annulata TaxID=5874 RepID=A0A3B0MTT9_THEAN